jgi:hypothetical protein
MQNEGFWYGTDKKEDANLPMPVANKKSWKNQELFLKALKLIESKNPPDLDHCYMGWSDCRLCGCQNGTMEFELDGWLWPEGFGHYIEKHNVKPSGEFITFILKKSQAELSSK